MFGFLLLCHKDTAKDIEWTSLGLFEIFKNTGAADDKLSQYRVGRPPLPPYTVSVVAGGPALVTIISTITTTAQSGKSHNTTSRKSQSRFIRFSHTYIGLLFYSLTITYIIPV